MTDKVRNIIQQYSVDDLERFQKILSSVINKRKNKLTDSITLYKFSNEYKKYISSTFSKKYLISVIQSFKHLLKHFGEDKKLEEISIRDVELFKSNLIKSAPKGSAIYLRTLKAAFNKALEWEYISFNAFSKIVIKKNQQIKPAFINRKELQKIIDRTDDDRMKDIFIFAFNTGCRLNEVVNIKWSNVDLSKKCILIRDSSFTTKNRKQRLIPLSKELKILLLELKKRARKSYKYLFYKDYDFPFCGDYVSKQFKRAVRGAGLSDEIHFHTLRHSFGSNLANRGVPIIAIKEMMGHSSITTTEIYSHTNLENLQREIVKLDVA